MQLAAAVHVSARGLPNSLLLIVVFTVHVLILLARLIGSPFAQRLLFVLLCV